MSRARCFLGIVIAMYYRDHGPPHFHAIYGEHEATADIATGAINIVEARYVRGYTVWLRFSDGSEGTVDLAEELTGPMFEPLRDTQVFSQVKLHPGLRALVWPHGADLAPEFLRDRLCAAA